MAERVTIKIDGKPYEVEAGKNLIEACKDIGIHIPHYCYHPALSIAGNCRMCLCKQEGVPKPIISCATQVKEGMEVYINHVETKQLQESVMEFLLINHPLDCPICDQSGECELQDYSYTYGADKGRFKEEKVQRTRTQFGPHVDYWGNRCIACTRCVRFLREITGTGELTLIHRADHAEISCHPDFPLDNPMSMNVVDICPVGALCSEDFLFAARVWNLKRTKGISPNDSMGINIYVDSQHNRIKRIVPRINMEAQGYFMPDMNRLDFEYVYYSRRLQAPKAGNQIIPYNEALQTIKQILVDTPKMTAVLVSLWQTNEAMFLIRELWKHMVQNDLIFVYGQDVEEDIVFPQFTIHGDKNPNRVGAQVILERTEKDHGIHALNAAIENGTVKNVLVLGSTPHYNNAETMMNWKQRLSHVVVMDFYQSVFAEAASLTLPAVTVYEQIGSFINKTGLVQRFDPAHEPITAGAAESELVWDILHTCVPQSDSYDPEVIFNRLAESVSALKGLSYASLGMEGKRISLD
jgi:NADH-quinone oxidoreductase subunit G